ncbi:hypothetical protein SeMB42_g01502 [Synchytrium endobioticum]|uniref:Cilia- and flagella-associated protein 251 n=1 Tax=Synchytrium endobioticum TaxID=286115 RepID=A0A507DN53_9FUNG|nr:hypothetical protein SeLEV6574_g01977 [Synchytrium endobioticum]TPX52310.1 hypothetical protein SeMB42_g01502 [Synchytrium endobioticum]
MATTSEDVQSQLSPNTLTLQWTFGLASNPTCSVYQLPNVDATTKARKLFYATSHTAVIRSLNDHDKQTLLQGHCHTVSSTALSPSGRFLATADHGPQSLLAVWDTQAEGPSVSAVTFDTFDGRYLATLGHDEEQTIYIWDWTTSAQPIATITVSGPRQNIIRFSPTDKYEISTTGNGGCSFFRFSPPSTLTQLIPAMDSNNPNQTSLNFSIPGYATNPPTALSGTTHGQIVLWKSAAATDQPKTILKVVKIHRGCITGLETLPDGSIVTSGSDGCIYVHDDKMRVIWTLDKLSCGPIDCISLIRGSEMTEVILATPSAYVYSLDLAPSTSRLAPQPASRKDAKLTSVKSMVNSKSSTTPQLRELFKGIAKKSSVVVCWPATTNFLVGHGAGVQIWDSSSRRSICSRTFGAITTQLPKSPSNNETMEKEEVTSACFSADGSSLAVGFSNGNLRFLQPSNLLDQPSPSTFSASKTHIQMMTFSPDGSHFAVADASFAVALFKKQVNGNWEMLGRCRAHTKDVVGVVFVSDKDSGSRLLSVGSDRFLAEYDVAQSTVSDGLRLCQFFKIEQTARPTAVTVLPDLQDTKGPSRLLVATDAHKLRLLDIEGHAWRRTVLGPPIPGKVAWMELLPPVQGSSLRYIIFRSDRKYIGLIKLPLDGNPYRTATVLAHPSAISSCSVSVDGSRVLTCGLNDGAVHLWKIDYGALEIRAASGGTGVYPFLELVDVDPAVRQAFVKEAEDFFYYCQILEQGEDTTEKRYVSDRISLEQVSNFMRALGYYPSEQDCEDLIREMQFGDLEYGGQVKEGFTLPDLIRLFVNYRPVAEVAEATLNLALETADTMHPSHHIDEDGTLAVSEDASIRRESLIALLQKHGEVMTREELDNALEHLTLSDAKVSRSSKWARAEFIDKVLGMEKFL